jgi:hypothetical protein
MHYRLAPVGVLVAVAAVSMASVTVVGQSAAPKPATDTTYTPPRTADGQPDLQGVWGYATITPMERPRGLAKEVFSDQEAAEFEKTTLANRDNDRRDDDPSRTRPVVNGGLATADVARAYNQFWWDYGTKIVGTKRTSLVVDPPDGRIPALTPAAQKRVAARLEAGERAAIGPEDRGLSERCINWGVAGPPMRPGAYNNNVQIVQSRDYVTIVNEMIHDARIVPLDGRPHLPQDIRQWMGDSRGRWEGNTLVVDTTNFTEKSSFNGSDENMHLTERFTLVDADTLLYEFTVDNPTAFTKPWSAQIPMSRNPLPMYEYACHEGNYGMFNILSGARAIEKAAADAARKGSQ